MKPLMTIPAIDYPTALVIISEIVDVNRFASQWKLVPYAGLCPTQRESGSKHWRGQITKEGSRWLPNGRPAVGFNRHGRGDEVAD